MAIFISGRFDGMTDDVIKVLDIAKTRNAVAGLDDDEKGAFTMGTPWCSYYRQHRVRTV